MRAAQYSCIPGLLFVLFGTAQVFSAEPETLLLASGSGTAAPQQPQCAVDPAGRVHVVFGQGSDVWYCRSLPNAGFSKPTLAFSVPNMSLGMRRGPRITALGQTLVVTAIGGPQGKGRDGDVLAWRSADDGKSWQGPVRVNDVEASAREGLHAMIGGRPDPASPAEVIWCVWLDLRNRRTELYLSRSDDGGLTWSQNEAIYTNPEKSICECCHPSIVMDGGNLHVLFRNSLQGNRDMYLLSSSDGGRHFSAAAQTGLAHWKLNACPMDGGMLAVVENRPMAVWRREGTVYRSVIGRPEETLGPGDQPWIAATNAGPVICWTTSGSRELLLLNPHDTVPMKLDSQAKDPVVVARHQTGAVTVLWEHRGERGQEVRAVQYRVGEKGNP
jgi:hypothetical protein